MLILSHKLRETQWEMSVKIIALDYHTPSYVIYLLISSTILRTLLSASRLIISSFMVARNYFPHKCCIFTWFVCANFTLFFITNNVSAKVHVFNAFSHLCMSFFQANMKIYGARAIVNSSFDMSCSLAFSTSFATHLGFLHKN